MSSGIRATVSFETPVGCPIAAFSRRTETTIDQLSTSVTQPMADKSTTEFLAKTDVSVASLVEECDDAAAENGNGDTEATAGKQPHAPQTDTAQTDRAEQPDPLVTESVFGPVFSYGETNLYRWVRDEDQQNSCPCSCPCACLGSFGCPVHRYTVDNGVVTLVFHATDFEELQTIMNEFRDRFPSVDVKRLLQPPLEGTPDERVFVNRGKLTDRQQEVLETAYRMGYFERPKGANATEVATELDITQSTVTEHLSAAQRKIFADVLGQ
ncbi:HTH-10 family transcription regulator (plasmid) [Natrialba magadii ATCC 43099]|uniref:Bacterio-opsin activator HTH domain-containing protein n=1 Tax=Natrialba magadii (strain ATCC 43099 / DSM 3394 / CCM 3739 / CIP 104546 / IAM 13178 / JCM 8861 / NBRC 102185 / NCIMB 2190 / MS3) TaxID=547559 RepID=D3T1J0_NATMM|nr:helix-turn-helix domain-containing protein [Natrialba magadii]ADD07449.1 HTH-10 family transcription regulator [Natrialba magadii ATCC 43099]ELY32255.1 bacterio-opsin activator HTH domain-containing protein [Natrialba magadii ATCC 43099]